MTITAEGPNEKTVYYEIDETQKFGYTVNYYIKDSTNAVPGLEALTGSAPVGAFTWSNELKTATWLQAGEKSGSANRHDNHSLWSERKYGVL